ncbi:ankyrin repeat-containing domain protein [Trichophaea hybrida]|nr:ankyrin repeat-containing domain protein [Trichophaea hybrida]
MAMEAIGLVIGIVGIYNTALQLFDQIAAIRDTSTTVGPLLARVAVGQHLLRRWGDKVGLLSNGNLHNPHHPGLDKQDVLNAVYTVLATIEIVMSDQKRLSDRYGLKRVQISSSSISVSDRCREISQSAAMGFGTRVRWTISDGKRFTGLVVNLEAIIDRLYVVLPPEDHLSSELRRVENSVDQHAQNILDSMGILTNEQRASSSRFNDMEDRDILALNELRELRSNIDDNARDYIESIANFATQQRYFNARFDDAERRSIFEWLDPVSTVDVFEEAVHNRTPQTCRWITNKEQFIQWFEYDSFSPNCLWIHASAGKGKTFISAAICEHIQTHSSQPLGYFFCVYADNKKRLPISILRSWIAQISTQRQDAFAEVVALRKYIRQSDELRVPTIEELWRLFTSIIKKVQHCRFMIDGLDECLQSDPETRVHLDSGCRIRFVKRLLSSIADSTARVLIVSRDEPDIRQGLGLTSASSEDVISVTEYAISTADTAVDTQLFAQAAVNEKLTSSDTGLRQQILSLLTSKAQGMFLWIRLEMNRLKDWQNASQLHMTLADMPNGLHLLEQTFRRSLLTISGSSDIQQRERALDILRWTMFAIRPLTVRELVECLAITKDTTEFPVEELPSVIDQKYLSSEILPLCGSLVVIKRPNEGENGPEDFASSTIHLAHFSVKEFLLKSEHTIDPTFSFFRDSRRNHARLADICLTYLLLQNFSDGPTDALSVRKQQFAFLEYAAVHLPLHIRSHRPHHRYHLLQKSLQLLDSSAGNYHAWLQVYYVGIHVIEPELPHPICLAARFDLVYELEALIRNGADVNLRSSTLRCPLEEAAFHGHLEAAMILLANGANPKDPEDSHQDRSASQPLYLAAEQGYVSIVELLLQSGVLINQLDGNGGTVLHSLSRSWNFQEGMLEVILASKCDVSIQDQQGMTALHLACENLGNDSDYHQRGGRDTVGRIIASLAPDKAITDLVDANGKTALHFAAQGVGDSVQAVRALLEAGGDPNIVDVYSESALNYAVQLGGTCRLDIIKDLLTSGADPDWNFCLIRALKNCNQGAAILLIEFGASLTQGDPLHLAVHNGLEDVVESILKKAAALVNSVNVAGLMPMEIVMDVSNPIRSRERIMYLLLEYGAHISPKAVATISAVTVGTMPERALPVVNCKDACGMTPLHWAVQMSSAIVEVLVTMGANVNASTTDGTTPLHLAAKKSLDLKVLEILLVNGADINAEKGSGETPLHEALVTEAPEGHSQDQLSEDLMVLEVVKLLVEHGAKMNSTTNSGTTPLHLSIAGWYIDTAKFLIRCGANVNARTIDGTTPLHIATNCCMMLLDVSEGSLPDILIAAGAAVDAKDDYGRTPFLDTEFF